MKPLKDIKNRVTQFNVNPRSEMRSKVLDEALEIQRDQKQKSTSDTYTWRIIMKSRKAQFTAAAVVVLATYLCLQIPKGLVAPAYALQDTIEAYNSVRYLHVKAFNTIAGTKLGSESWIECDEDGKRARFRVHLDWFSADSPLGPATFAQDGDRSHTWLPNLNLCFRRSGKSALTGALLQWTRSDVDPKLMFEKLQKQARDGEIILDVNEPDQKNESIVLVVTYPAESRSANWKKVLYIDQATRLVKKEEKFEMRGGQYQHERTTEFLDYNQQIDPEVFNLDAELPENVISIDLSDEVGLAQGDMTDEEVAKEVTSQALRVFIAGDFDKAGQLFWGVPGFFIEKLFSGNVLKKVSSVGPVHRDPDPDSHLMICSCKIIYEIGGQYYEIDTNVYVAPVSGQPGRWMICRIWGHSMRPASDDITLLEYEPTTEERARGFVAVQGRGPEPDPRLKKLEVDLGRNERDLAPVKLMGLSELDVVSISVSGPGAALCTPWIEKDYQLHSGNQTPLDMNNSTRLWLEVDSGKYDPGEYKLTVNLSSGRGNELSIPGTVTIHDVALPQERTMRMKPFSWTTSLSGMDIHKPETRKRLEVFLDDLAALRIAVCDWVYTYNPANVLHQVKIAGTDQTLHAAGQAGSIDINNLPDLDYSFCDPWIVGSVEHGMTQLEINVRLYITEHERAFAKGVLGDDIVCSDEMTWEMLMWLYDQFRDYAISRGMTETWARIDESPSPETIPDYVQTARRYQKIGYRTYTDNVDRFTRNATYLNQLNAQSDSWYMSYFNVHDFVTLTHKAPKGTVQLDEDDQIWYAGGGSYSRPYEEGRATAWRARAIGAHGYSWHSYKWRWEDSEGQIVWYDEEAERMIHSPTWHGLRDGNEDAAYYHMLQQRLQAKGDEVGLARLAALTGSNEDAPLRMVETQYVHVCDDFVGTIGFQQFNQAKREVLRMLCADQR